MPNNNDPLSGVHFSYTPGKCLVCEKPSGSKLFCPECESGGLDRESRSTATVSALASGQYGYISSHDVFANGERYFVFTDAKFVGWPKDDQTVKIWRSGHSYVIDMRSLDFSRLGYVGLNCVRPFEPVILDVDHAGPAFAILSAKKITDMGEEEVGYIESKSIYYQDGDLYVLASDIATSVRDGDKKIRITRYEWGVELDHTTIEDDDILSVFPAGSRRTYLRAHLA